MIDNQKYPNGSIYLSGGMQFAKNMGTGWRAEISPQLKEMGYYPIDIAALDIAYAKAHGELYHYDSKTDHLQFKSNLRVHFIETDINLLKFDTDALIIYYDESVRRGAGTTSEVHEAFMMDMPVFMVNSYGDLKEVPGWMQAETTKIFNTFEELHCYLNNLQFYYPGILKRDKYGNRRSGNHYLCSMCGEVEEKHKTHYVSKVSPMLCKRCVDIVKETHESRLNRYEFFKTQLGD